MIVFLISNKISSFGIWDEKGGGRGELRERRGGSGVRKREREREMNRPGQREGERERHQSSPVKRDNVSFRR